jgi:ketosteroid isomerase-like protein
MSESHDPFLQVLDLYKAAVRAKDVDAFLAIYDDDVHVFDMWGTWSLRGIEAWRNIAVDWFSSLGTEQVVVSADEVTTTRIGQMAVGHAILTYTAMSAEGKKLRSLNNRITVALRRTGEAWKIFHEHTSAPIDHQSTKAMLQRAGDG